MAEALRREQSFAIVTPTQPFVACLVDREMETKDGRLVQDGGDADAAWAALHVDGMVGAMDLARQGSALFKVLTDAMPQMVWSTLPDGFHDYYNARWYEFTGMPVGSTDGGERWNGMFHPDDQERARDRWSQSLQSGEPYEIEYRLRHHTGQYRWVLGRALPVRAEDERLVRWIGTCTDIDASKRQGELTELMSRELSHRIKNIFAVVSGLVALSAADHPQAAAYAKELRSRILALGRAHEFVRPHSEQSAPSCAESTVHAMTRDILAPYPALATGHITISGDDVPVDETGATPIALAFHELATNAAKYGALSVIDGKVAIETTIDDDDFAVRWTETGGPPVAGEPDKLGFGTHLAELSIAEQLGGTIERQWHPSGLIVAISIPRKRLMRFSADVQRP